MKFRLAFVVTLAFALLGNASIAFAGASTATTYYVSLGDSLAAGTQPNLAVPGTDVLFTSDGYADQLFRTLQKKSPKLQLLKLGCPGETTASMIAPDLPFEGRGAGFACNYPHGSQLAEAVNFLHAHRRFVTVVTIDIGPNDIFRGGGVAAIQANLPVILAALREAAGPGIPIVGMNFYDPFLADLWFGAPSGFTAELARAIGFNDFVEAIYAGAGDPVADVETAFSMTDTTLVGGVPLDVLRVCQWTWECAPAHNVHANAAGYGVIAKAFASVIP